MVQNWTARLASRRFGAMRLVLVAFGLGYLLLLRDPSAFAPRDWAIAVAALMLCWIGAAGPLSAAIGQSALLLAAELTAPAVLLEVKIGVAAAVLDVALRRWGRPAVVAALAVAAAELLGAGSSGPWIDGLPAALYRSALVGGVPLLVAGYLRSKEQAAQAAQERAREAERGRELAEWGARAGERAAIARELHDMVAHHLSSTVLRVGVAQHVLPQTDPRLTEVLADVRTSATAALADLRRLLTALRDPEAQQLAPLLADPADLPDAVADVVSRAETAGVRVAAEISPQLAELDAVRGLTVLRLVQEGLANVVKHGGAAAEVRLLITRRGAAMAVELENTVTGPTRQAPGWSPVTTGYGLLGMRERVALVGGTIEAGPVAGGWRLAALLSDQLPGRLEQDPPAPPLPGAAHARVEYFPTPGSLLLVDPSASPGEHPPDAVMSGAVAPDAVTHGAVVPDVVLPTPQEVLP
ncbi:signal transduction histidine kinase [Kitasatospora sp. GP30]|uniref:sensor histidine kinase n=1 Tax=Kitasatospora sp. GP30 TaxID=3035084 RepID=UPI000C7030EE|nr:histidine kinase [Kitasatospora sp. GP30]MDH6142387.1 signal transduction histidine kinase [Kitasatospora sp. GP30]